RGAAGRSATTFSCRCSRSPPGGSTRRSGWPGWSSPPPGRTCSICAGTWLSGCSAACCPASATHPRPADRPDRPTDRPRTARRPGALAIVSGVTERTLVLIKPDAVARGLIGEIIARIERKGLTPVAVELRTATEEVAAAHYAEHADKPFYPDLISFITSAPLV